MDSFSAIISGESVVKDNLNPQLSYGHIIFGGIREMLKTGFLLCFSSSVFTSL